MKISSRRQDYAVSEIIGTVLLISIVVLAGSVIAVAVLSQPQAQKIPSISTVTSIQSQTVSIKHDGGDALQNGTYLILINGIDLTSKFNPPATWSIGETLTYTLPGTTPPSSVQIEYIGSGSPVIVASSSFGPAGPVAIVASASSGGIISPNGAVSVPYGGSQTFTITPNSGYYISGVFADSVSQGQITSYTFTNVTTAHTISASFSANPVITASAGAHGTITPNGSVSVPYGGSQTFTITPNSGYSITGVFVDSVSQGQITSYTFTNVTTAHTISASFTVIPTYTSLSPTTGPLAGGTSVTITGTGFTGATLVTFGGTSAYFTVNNDTSITATAPANATAGTVNVAITTPGGTATGTNAYTYLAAPTFGGISPTTGPSSGGTSVTITGTNFVNGATSVTIGGTAATSVSVSGSTSLTAVTPASSPSGSVGLVNVVVTTAGGSATGTNAFDYYLIQTFTSSGTSNVPSGATTVQYLVVAGGGGGGGLGGGGGAGGVLTGTLTGLTTSYSVTVGTGGAGGTTAQGSSGGNSVFASVTATGGGGGGTSSTTATTTNGGAGGSGGGSSTLSNGAHTAGTVGSGTAGQGNNGGLGAYSSRTYGGGGGGAGSTGGTLSGTTAGSGGAGVSSTISGSSVTYGGGGGGGAASGGGAGGSGGSGGGGSGALNTATPTAGTANTGGGGGGSGSTTVRGGTGGSGIVILKYY